VTGGQSGLDRACVRNEDGGWPSECLPRRTAVLHYGKLVVEHAAVDQQHLTGDVVGVGAGEEGHDLGDVFGGFDPAEGDAVYGLLEVLADGLAVDLAELLVDE
jgi:hypothetical protein